MERLGPGLTVSYQKNADTVTVRAGGGGGGSSGFGNRRQRRPQRRERADAAAAAGGDEVESESPAEAAEHGEGEVVDRSTEGKRTRNGRLALPAVIRSLSSVPVRVTSLFESGKRPEVVASLHLDLVRCPPHAPVAFFILLSIDTLHIAACACGRLSPGGWCVVWLSLASGRRRKSPWLQWLRRVSR